VLCQYLIPYLYLTVKLNLKMSLCSVCFIISCTVLKDAVWLKVSYNLDVNKIEDIYFLYIFMVLFLLCMVQRFYILNQRK